MAPHKRWSRARKLALGAGAAVAVLALAFFLIVPSNAELAARLQAQAEDNLGVPVRLGEVRWQLFPLALVIEDAATEQPEPIRFKRMVVQPVLHQLLRRELRLHHVLVEDGVLPQLSLRALRIKPSRAGAPATEPLVEQLRFDRLTWITRRGVPLVFDGQLLFDPGWRPREGEVARTEVATPTRMSLRRQGSEDRWQLQLQLGGGTAEGAVALAPAADGKLQLSGQLELAGVEVHSAMAAFKRNSVLRGQASGRTELKASGAGLPDLVRSLNTSTRFTMAPATLLRMDVDKAIRSFGQERSGQTRMSSLTGQMETQNTAEGIVVRYRGLQAKGETFSASGAATIANRQVNADITVDLVGGLIGVPLKVSGPLAQPTVTVPGAASAGAVAGAAIGTAVLPGVGTAIGAGVGAAIGKLFGNEGGSKQPAVPPPRKP